MTATTRLLCIMGSGEMSPRMAAVHADLIGRIDAHGYAVMLDTPYGFQENADELSQRAIAYFHERVGHPLRIASLRNRDLTDPIVLERLYNELAAYTDEIRSSPGEYQAGALRHKARLFVERRRAPKIMLQN